MSTYGNRNSAVTLSLIVFCAACESPSGVVTVGKKPVIIDTPAAQVPVAQLPMALLNSSPADGLLCDPFFENPSHPGFDLYHGIVASLSYVPASVPKEAIRSLADYQNYAVPVDATLFLGDLNVAARIFRSGFLTRTGKFLKDESGQPIFRFFSLHFQSQIQLTSVNTPGAYQFAIQSDGGAILQADTGLGFKVLIDNDGDHDLDHDLGRGFAVSKIPVTFDDANSTLPIQLDYFHGDHSRLSLRLFWRPWPSQQGSDWKKPGWNKNDKTNRRWRPVPAANFILPSAVTSNPCHQDEPVSTTLTDVVPADIITSSPSISFSFSSNFSSASFNCSLDGGALSPCESPQAYADLVSGSHQFAVFATANGQIDSVGASYLWAIDSEPPQVVSGSVSVTVTGSSFTVNWATNEPSTSTLLWGLGSDVSQALPEDTNFTTNHSMTVTGVSPLTIYSYTFGGVDPAGNKVSSGPFRVRTNR